MSPTATMQSLCDPSDIDWRGKYDDFNEFNDVSSIGVPSSLASSFDEAPTAELGLYDQNEDIYDWSFNNRWADDQWQELELTLSGERKFYGPVRGSTGQLCLVPAPPIHYFFQFWPPHMLAPITRETNKYAKQASHKHLHLTNGRRDWVDLTQEELMCWIGVLILMGLKVVPHQCLYWDIRSFCSCSIITQVMSRHQFEAIICCLHLANNEALLHNQSHPRYDKIGKVRGVIEGFSKMSQSLYNNEAICTIDEIMVPYEGRFCGIWQYMKSKQVKFGIKI